MCAVVFPTIPKFYLAFTSLGLELLLQKQIKNLNYCTKQCIISNTCTAVVMAIPSRFHFFLNASYRISSAGRSVLLSSIFNNATRAQGVHGFLNATIFSFFSTNFCRTFAIITSIWFITGVAHAGRATRKTKTSGRKSGRKSVTQGVMLVKYNHFIGC